MRKLIRKFLSKFFLNNCQKNTFIPFTSLANKICLNWTDDGLRCRLGLDFLVRNQHPLKNMHAVAAAHQSIPISLLSQLHQPFHHEYITCSFFLISLRTFIRPSRVERVNNKLALRGGYQSKWGEGKPTRIKSSEWWDCDETVCWSAQH